MSATTQGRKAKVPHQLGLHAVGREATGRDRRPAVEHWLLAAADDVTRARREWQEYGVTLLRCGRSFDAVRVPRLLVEAAAGTADRARLGRYIRAALLGGPAFLDAAEYDLYCLVPPATSTEWRVPGTECLGKDAHLSVPHLGVAGAPRSSWLSEPVDADAVCVRPAVAQLVVFGRFRARTQGGG
ncbi:hypothetical protein ACIPPJ_24865 [Streptomyces sp. NPDC086091]|uniref:hypothetical protein n=1 Tax=Streptomyces sp. NPDC086091 TaxID=3365751 RepID=UPI0037FEF45C